MVENQNISSPELTVEKRSGNSERFDEEKLVRGISRAGAPFVLAKDISKSIIDKLKQKPNQNSISSIKIRDYVVEELKDRNKNTIAESYSGYSKNKITPLKEEQFENNKHHSKVSPSVNTHSKQDAKDIERNRKRNK